MGVILAIDQGTTGTTALLYDHDKRVTLSQSNAPFRQHYPTPGWVEHDLEEIWQSFDIALKEALEKAKITASKIEAIGITNQRETTCFFDKNGRPLSKAIVWQDRRTQSFCDELKTRGMDKAIRQKTGLPLDPYFSGTKLNWLNSQLSLEKGLVGTIDTFLLYRLTGNRVHATEASNASRTLLMNLKTTKWDCELLDIFKVPSSTLAEIKPSMGLFGKTSGHHLLPDGIPITGILGDQQSALFGQQEVSPGGTKCTYGTGAFALSNTGEQIIFNEDGLLTTVAYQTKNYTHYALEGSCYIAGAVVTWLKEQLGIIQSSAEVESLARQVTDLKEMEGLLFLPFFSGLGTPYWKDSIRGTLVGLTRGTQKAHLARAALEGIAYSVEDILSCFKKEQNLTGLKIDGGAGQNNLLAQIQADLSGVQIQRPKEIETTALGAIYAALVGAGHWSIEDVKKLELSPETFDPQANQKDYFSKQYGVWKETIQRF